MSHTRRVSTRTLLVVGLLVALVLAGVASYYASASPDGLNRVAGDLGFAGAEQASGTQDGPLAGYDVAGRGTRWSGGLAGIIGCLVVLAGTSTLMLVRRRATPRRADGGE
jgi:cobalt/nickel transport protein